MKLKDVFPVRVDGLEDDPFRRANMGDTVRLKDVCPEIF